MLQGLGDVSEGELTEVLHNGRLAELQGGGLLGDTARNEVSQLMLVARGESSSRLP